MKKVYGIIEASISKTEVGLWYDHDRRKYDPYGWGIVVKVMAGSFARPVPKFWTKKNCWQEEAWFTVRLPFIVLPFISIAIWRFGFYLGGKAFTVDSDEPWAKPSEYGDKKLTISATIRKTRDV